MHLSYIINLTVAECKKIRNVSFRINYFVNKYREGLIRQIDVSILRFQTMNFFLQRISRAEFIGRFDCWIVVVL